MSTDHSTGLELRSLLKSSGELELSLADVANPQLAPNQILVRMEAAPINPSDLGLLLASADLSTAVASGTAQRPVITTQLLPNTLRAFTSRLDQSMPVGNEGAGVVVKAGAEAQALLGKSVALIGGAMYAQYRVANINEVLPLPSDVTPAEGASWFVNPLTALGFVDTMRNEGHSAIVHTAAASNLGQMLNKLCLKDSIGLVNVVRSEDQAALLRSQGATHVCNSSAPTFMADLIAAIEATGATIAFDAIGGGKLVSQILTAMEVVANKSMKEYSRYGSSAFKQAYIYGGLDMSPTELARGFGFAWSLGGWLLFPFMQKAGPARVRELQQRIAGELKTTFASSYTATISLQQALQLDVIKAYAKRATGEKYLINPAL